MRFHIFGGGDSLVGIPPTEEVVVTFESTIVWDEELVNMTKEMLKEWDDNGAVVLTEKEYRNYINQQEAIERDCVLNAIREAYVEKDKEEFIKYIGEVLGEFGWQGKKWNKQN